jgi:geranylgeranyl pyrophosphate synthase
MTTVSSEAALVLVTAQERINALLEKVLGGQPLAAGLQEAMRYAVLNGGKRVRPALAYAAAQACGAEAAVADAGAIAVELIHCYSLVHDDLPCMDDDDLRRGLPTCHRQFDEATALLAGDALQALAFSILTESSQPVETMARQVSALSHAAHDMVVGQTLDLAAEGKDLDRAALETIHRHKTGALIRAAVAMGGLAASASPAQLMALDTYAAKLGLAFQVQDDVLDVIGDTSKIGKQAGADAAREKATYPALLGLAGAQRLAVQLHDEAVEALAPLGQAALPLHQLAAFLVSRDY